MRETNSPITNPAELPLGGLQAFEAAARLGSFRAAADALGVTPSAISHRIRTLERSFGATLFHRNGRAVVLTPVGARLLRYVRRGFASFLRGAASVAEGVRAQQIRVSTLALFNQTVLIPNLAEFAVRWPEYEVHVEVSARMADFDLEDVDIAIRVGNGRWPGVKSSELLPISGTPVASPVLVRGSGIRSPRDLVGVRLIHHTALPKAWGQWLAAQGIDERDARGDLWFDSATATLQAAEQGLGVALAIDPLVRFWPTYGEMLVRPFPDASGPSLHYWLAYRRESTAEPKIRAFEAWVREACEAVLAA